MGTIVYSTYSWSQRIPRPNNEMRQDEKQMLLGMYSMRTRYAWIFWRCNITLMIKLFSDFIRFRWSTSLFPRNARREFHSRLTLLDQVDQRLKRLWSTTKDDDHLTRELVFHRAAGQHKPSADAPKPLPSGKERRVDVSTDASCSRPTKTDNVIGHRLGRLQIKGRRCLFSSAKMNNPGKKSE